MTKLLKVPKQGLRKTIVVKCIDILLSTYYRQNRTDTTFFLKLLVQLHVQYVYL